MIGCAPGAIGPGSRGWKGAVGHSSIRSRGNGRQGAEALACCTASRYSQRGGRRCLAQCPLPRQSPRRAKSPYGRGRHCSGIHPSRPPRFCLTLQSRGSQVTTSSPITRGAQRSPERMPNAFPSVLGGAFSGSVSPASRILLKIITERLICAHHRPGLLVTGIQ